jgi:RNA polymerase sigma factor (TIGR02999 family)
MSSDGAAPKEAARPRGDVTDLLVAWSNGDEKALASLVPLVYEELRHMAERYLARESPGHTLQPTALVHETYLKLVDQNRATWKNRGHFFAVAAQTMRRLLVDYARHRDADKRGGSSTRVALEEASSIASEQNAEVIALDEALDKLALLDKTQAQIVELRYFGGLTLDEIAEATGSSPSTVGRAFRLAKAWLYRELSVA